MIEPGLRGKVALITGVNNPLGIGAAAATALAGQGTKVFVTGFRPASGMTEAESKEAEKAGSKGRRYYEAMLRRSTEDVAREIESRGGIVAWNETDLAEPDNIPLLFDHCENRLGPVDILINNHAYWVPDTFNRDFVTDEGYGMRLASGPILDAHYAVNSRAPALLMAEFAARYVKRPATWGRIINISTDAADAHLGAVSYAATKHALESLSRSAAVELAKSGITVNIVAPGPIQTGWLSPDQEAEIGDKIPLGRIGRPEDVADVIVFLASDQARWLTGQLIYAGGGWKMHQ